MQQQESDKLFIVKFNSSDDEYDEYSENAEFPQNLKNQSKNSPNQAGAHELPKPVRTKVTRSIANIRPVSNISFSNSSTDDEYEEMDNHSSEYDYNSDQEIQDWTPQTNETSNQSPDQNISNNIKVKPPQKTGHHIRPNISKMLLQMHNNEPKDAATTDSSSKIDSDDQQDSSSFSNFTSPVIDLNDPENPSNSHDPHISISTSSSQSNSNVEEIHRPCALLQKVYKVVETRVLPLSKMELRYKFYKLDGNGSLNQMFTAKCKIRENSPVYINSGTEAHYRYPEGVMLVDKKKNALFSLRTNADFEREILAIKYRKSDSVTHFSRVIQIDFNLSGLQLTQSSSLPSTLSETNMKPSFYPTPKQLRTRAIEFKDMFPADCHPFTVKSSKNAILSENSIGPSFLIFRKVENHALEIETRFEHDPMWMCAIGISSFLNKMK